MELRELFDCTVLLIFHAKIVFKKISARLLPSLLTVENKRNYLVDSVTGLELLGRNPHEFLSRYATVNKTCDQTACFCRQRVLIRPGDILLIHAELSEATNDEKMCSSLMGVLMLKIVGFNFEQSSEFASGGVYYIPILKNKLLEKIKIERGYVRRNKNIF